MRGGFFVRVSAASSHPAEAAGLVPDFLAPEPGQQWEHHYHQAVVVPGRRPVSVQGMHTGTCHTTAGAPHPEQQPAQAERGPVMIKKISGQ